MSETLIPTHGMRWFRDYDGDRILQQRFVRPSGGETWVAVPEEDYWSLKDEEESRKKAAIRALVKP